MTAAVTVAGPEALKPRISRDARLAIAVFALGVLCYANAVRGDFVFDDIKLIVNNDIVKDPGRVSEILFTNLWGLLGRGSDYCRPLPPVAFMLLHSLFGMRPDPFHLLNIVLHAAAACLVFLTGRTLLTASGVSPARALWSAFAAAALFAVHPIHTEAVAWISGLMDVSCAAFSLLAIYLYITADSSDRRLLPEVLLLAALLLALLSKEPAAVVPFVLMAYDLLFVRQKITNAAVALRRWGPAFGVLIGYLCLRGLALGGVAPFRHAQQASVLEVLLTVPRLFALYIQKLVVPVALNVVYDLDPIATPASPEFLWTLVIIVAFGGISWVAVRTGRTASFGLLLFLLALAPALCVPALSQDLSKAFAERYVYLPSAGAALVLAAALATVGSESRRLAAAGVALVVALFSGITISRNAVWKDSLTLWSDGVRKSPDLPLAHENLGLALIRRGRECEGNRELRVALRLAPESARNAMQSGVLAARNGVLMQAVLSFQTALRYNPQFTEAHYNLALALEQLGWVDAAVREYRATLAQSADHADAHNNLGILLAQHDGLDEAIEHFKAAVRSRPDDPELHLNLARAFDIKGLSREAEEQRALAAAARPASPR